jgi:penicillin-binding protein 1A
VVTAIWTGNDDNAPTDHATGGGPPALIFSAYMQSAPHSGLASGHSRPVEDGQSVAPPPGEAETVTTPAEREEPRDPIAAFLAGLGGPDSE